jgi:hypothetical protein
MLYTYICFEVPFGRMNFVRLYVLLRIDHWGFQGGNLQIDLCISSAVYDVVVK